MNLTTEETSTQRRDKRNMNEVYAEIQNNYQCPAFLTNEDKSYESLERKDDCRYEKLKKYQAKSNSKERKGVDKEISKDKTFRVSVKTLVAIIISVGLIVSFVTMTSLIAIKLNKSDEQNQSSQKQTSRLKNIIVSPHSWSSNGRSVYILFQTKRTWRESQAWCSDIGGTLAEIETEEENTFIRNNTLSEANEVGGDVWIGGTDKETEGVWKWASRNTKIDFTFWGFSEPNNYRGTEHCLELAGVEGWPWNDFECGKRKRFLCEILSSQ